jgi:hypothetical protein
MNNNEFDISDIVFDAEEWDKVDMHGYPVYQSVKEVERDLKEEQLRKQHADLSKAYDDYQILLKKYGFWDKITK